MVASKKTTPPPLEKRPSMVRFEERLSEEGSAANTSSHPAVSSIAQSEAPQSARSLLSQQSLSSAVSSGTYAGQSQLPRLPIPTLDETLSKLPKVLEALQTEQQQAQTLQTIQEFLQGDGPQLQQALIDYQEEKIASGEIGSYVEEFWNDSYLSPDASVVLNLNPFFVLEDGPDPKIAKDQLRRAASLCFASTKLASLLKTETLSPDIFKGKPLCMDQFKVLYGASRQPSVDSSDDVHVYNDSTHGTLFCRNCYWTSRPCSSLVCSMNLIFCWWSMLHFLTLRFRSSFSCQWLCWCVSIVQVSLARKLSR